jgi:hypothetical protein
MLIKAKTLNGYKLNGLDQEIGKVQEFYFDDTHWAVRYLVVDTGTWLTDRKVLISPYALGAVNQEYRNIAVHLTKKQIEDSPSLDSDKPVSRQFEEEYHGFYGWPLYWVGPHMWGFWPSIKRDPEEWKKIIRSEKGWDPNLISTHDVNGHHVQASDGEIGHVEEFIIDDEMWAIRYLVIDTRNWWPGKKVLISPRWIERISWDEQKVFVNHTREAIKLSPEYREEPLLTRDYETGLHRHYNRKGYWEEGPIAGKHSR